MPDIFFDLPDENHGSKITCFHCDSILRFIPLIYFVMNLTFYFISSAENAISGGQTEDLKPEDSTRDPIP